MKQFKFQIAAIVLTCLILIITTTSSQKKISQKVNMHAMETKGFVIMELFTSQGCSSCPPADALLGKYAGLQDDHVIPLAFHVDYWNRLGWKDPFSNAKYSQRQRDYAMLIENSSVYTPQLVINGEKEFVGSDAAKISNAVDVALKTSAGINIIIGPIIKQEKNLHINFNLNKTISNITLHAALVQKQGLTNILRGENSGLKLTNYNVVRDFNSIHVNDASSFINLAMPDEFKDLAFTIVLYVQEDASGKIIGAVQKAL